MFVILCVAVATLVGCARTGSGDITLTVASTPFESLGLVFVAQERGYFRDNGLDVTFSENDTGVAALEAVIAGDADIAVGTAEFPLVKQAFADVPVRALAIIDRPDFIYLVGRKDRGIQGPADLKGKRIGTTAGSIAQFYLGRFLELNDMTAEEITFVDLKTSDEWRAAIGDGTVDAVVLAQPEASVVAGRLGDNATFISAQESQPAFTLAIGMNEWIEENPEAVERFLRALQDAEEFVAANPDETVEIITETLKLSDEYSARVRGQNSFALSLDQSLVVAMEDEARWMIRNKVTTDTVIPDFGRYIHVDGMQAIKPGAVNVLR
ncbi:MAG: ABC transporter substrate-binding protein [Coriobacteriia bacterium]